MKKNRPGNRKPSMPIDEEFDLDFQSDVDRFGQKIEAIPRITEKIIESNLKEGGKNPTMTSIAKELDVPMPIVRDVMKNDEFKDYLNDCIPVESAMLVLKQGLTNYKDSFKFLELYFKLMGRLNDKQTIDLNHVGKTPEMDMLRQIIDGKVEHVYAGQSDEEEESDD